MSRRQRFLCGVPKDECTGGILHTDQTFTTTKCHASREEAFSCMRRFLIRQQFVPLSTREFVNPQTGSIRILPKKSKFGGRLRSGKGEDGARFEPESGKGGGGGSGLIY